MAKRKKIITATTTVLSAAAASSTLAPITSHATTVNPITVRIDGLLLGSFFVQNNSPFHTLVMDAPNNVHTETLNADRFDIRLGLMQFDLNAETTIGSEGQNPTTVGFHSKLMLSSNTTTKVANAVFDRVYMYAKGKFGQFQLGATNNVSMQMHYTSPWYIPGNGVDSPNFFNIISGCTNTPFLPQGKYDQVCQSFSASVRTSTFALMSRRANKLVYFTPNVSGFQIGVAYTPDIALIKANNHFLPVVEGQNPGSVKSIFDVSANYSVSKKINGRDFKFGVDGFFSIADKNDNGTSLAATRAKGATPLEYGMGTSLTYGPMTYGAAIYLNNDIQLATIGTAMKDDHALVWTVGAEYAVGKWTMGVSALHGVGWSKVQAQALNPNSQKTFRPQNFMLETGAGYTIAKGIQLGMEFQFDGVKYYNPGYTNNTPTDNINTNGTWVYSETLAANILVTF